MNKRIISMILVLSMCLSLIPNIVLADTNIVTLDVNPSPKVEVALSVGDTMVNYSTFEVDLKNALKTRGIDDNDIVISSVEAQSSNTSNNFQWWTYDHTVYGGAQTIDNTNHIYVENITPGEIGSQNANNSKNRHIVTTQNGATMDLYGYGMSGYKDFNFLPNSQSTKKVIEFTVEEKSAYDALDGVGFLINSSITGTYPSAQLINGYLLFFQYNTGGTGSGIKLFKLKDVNAYTLHHNSTSATFEVANIPGATLLGTATYSTAKYKKFKIEVLPDSVKLWFAAGTGNSIFNTTLSDSNLVNWKDANYPYNDVGTSFSLTANYDTVGSNSVFRGGYGPLISYRSHSCERLTYFQLSNLTMTQDYVRSLTEIIREPEWHDDYSSFLVNLNESIIEDFSHEYTTAEIINRLSDEDITYIGWCGSKNVDASQIFATQLGDGALVNVNATATNTYNKQIAAIADAIVNKINAKKSESSNTFLVEDQFSFSAIGASLNDGEWSVGYSTSGYGVNETIDAYADLATASFATPGYYRIYHGDTSMFIEQIRIHESPVSAFTLSSSASGITAINKSYDPEFCSDVSAATGSLTDGIKTSIFEYMNLKSASPSWITTAPTSLSGNDVWLVRLTVTDNDGVTTTMMKQVSLGSTATVPYNSFILSDTTLVKGITSPISVDIIDQSYSLNGLDIVTASYTVKDSSGNVKSTFTLNSGETKNLVVTDYANGTYTVSMNATATSGSTTSETSPTVSRTFKIVNGYLVSYNANEGNGAPSNQVKIDNQNLTLASTAPTRSGFIFKHWTDSSNNIYSPGASYTVNAALTLTAQWKSIPILTLSNKTAVYNGNTLAIDVATVTGATIDEVSYYYYSDINCTLTTTPINVGTYFVRASVIATEDHPAAYSNVATLTINPTTIAINVSDKTVSYTGSNIEIDAATISGIDSSFIITTDISYTYYTDISCTTLTTSGNSGALNNGGAPKYAGKYYVKATIAASNNYKTATTVAPATLIITSAGDGGLSIGSNLTKYYGDSSFKLSAIGGSGTGLVTFASSNPLVASVTADGYVTINAVGNTTVTATKSADGNYDAQSTNVTITVNAKVVTYDITNNIKTYTAAAQYATVKPNVTTLVEGRDYTVTYKKDDTVVSNPTEKGEYTITVLTINDNYSGIETGTLTIGSTIQSELHITGVPVNDIQYNDAFSLTANGGSGSGNVTFTSSNEDVATIDLNTGAVEIKGVGIVTITATKAADANFNVQTAKVTFTTTPKAINVTARATNRVYQIGNKIILVDLSTDVDDVTAGYVSATVRSANAGTDKEVTITGVSISDPNYKAMSTTIYTAVTIYSIEDTDLIIDGVPSSITYGDADFRLTALSLGTGEVFWSSNDSSVAKVNSKTGVVTITGVGNASITADKESDGNYHETSAYVKIKVVKKEITFSIVNNTKSYTGEAQYATVTPSVSSLKEGVDYIVTYSSEEYQTDAGEYAINVENLNENYVGGSTDAILTIQSVDQTYKLEIGGLPSFIEYEDTFALYANGGNGEGEVSWSSDDETVAYVNSSGKVEIIGVGTATITATKSGDGNYEEQEQSITFTTNKKEISIAIGSTAKTYNGKDQEVAIRGTATITPLEDIIKLSYVMQADDSKTVFRNIGTYNVSAEVDDSYSKNYVLRGYPTAVATMAKAKLTIKAVDKTKDYGDGNPGFTMAYDLLGTDKDSEFNEPEITCNADETSSVGSYPIELFYNGDHGNDNYDITLQNGTLTVNPRKVTVTWQDTTSYVYNSTEQIVTATLSNKANDDIIDFTYTGSNGTNVNGYTSEITGISGEKSNNYSLPTSGLKENWNITKAKLNVTADDKSIKYKDAVPKYTVTYDSFVGTEDTSVLGGELNLSCEYVKDGDSGRFTITPSGWTSDNYDIVFTEGTLTVAQLPITVIVSGSTSNIQVSLFPAVGGLTLDKFIVMQGENIITPTAITENSSGSRYTLAAKLTTGSKYTVMVNNGDNYLFNTGEFTAITPSSSGGGGGGSDSASNVEKIEEDLFTDVKKNDWFYDAVQYVNEAGLMIGTSTKTFEPNLEISRAMIVTILYRLEDEPKVTKLSSFKDVVSGTWYTDAVDWASNNGIVTGYDAQTFGPNNNITHEQMVAILYRYAKYKGYDLSKTSDLSTYTDASDISSWALTNMKWAVAEGLMAGTTTTKLSPTGDAIRARVADMLMRFMQNIGK